MKKTINLPQYSREFTAGSGSSTTQTIILVLVSFFLASFTIGFKAPNPLESALSRAQATLFFDPLPHLDLAQIYYNSKNYNLAQKEIDIIKSLLLLKYDKTIYENTNLLENQLLETPLSETKINNHWISIVNKYPDYKESLIMLMYLAKNQNNHKKLEEYRTKLGELNPNYLNELPQELQ